MKTSIIVILLRKILTGRAKKIQLLIMFAFFIEYSNAQEVLSIQEHEGTINQFKIFNIDSISFNVNTSKDSTNKSFLIHEKSGSVLKYDVSTIDSLTFVKRNVLNKRGFVIIRVDDNYPSKEIVPMANVLDKFGYKLSYSFNPGIATRDMIDAAKTIQLNGHEITDHTPNHTTAYADMRTKEQASRFVGIPGVERIDNLRIYFDWVYPDLSSCIVANDSIEITAGSGVIKLRTKAIPIWTQQIYTTEFGWILLTNITSNQATAIHAKSGQKLVFAKSSKEPLYLIDSYSVIPSVDGMKALMSASQILFNDLGIQCDKYWVMCGGPWAIGKGAVLREAGTPLGYFGGSEHSYSGNIQMTYNQINPLSRWSSSILSIQSDITPVSTLKRVIANEVAKHLGVIDLVHMWYKNKTYCTIFTGTNDEKLQLYLNNLEEMLRFCYDNDIPG